MLSFTGKDRAPISAYTSTSEFKINLTTCKHPKAAQTPGPVSRNYFPVVPKALKGMRKCLDKVVKKNDGTIVIIPCKGTQVTELGRESED